MQKFLIDFLRVGWCASEFRVFAWRDTLQRLGPSNNLTICNGNGQWIEPINAAGLLREWRIS